PSTLGGGYDVIDEILAGTIPVKILALLCAMKFVSWSISLGSGTSGGTLAPLLIIYGRTSAPCWLRQFLFDRRSSVKEFHHDGEDRSARGACTRSLCSGHSGQ